MSIEWCAHSNTVLGMPQPAVSATVCGSCNVICRPFESWRLACGSSVLDGLDRPNRFHLARKMKSPQSLKHALAGMYAPSYVRGRDCALGRVTYPLLASRTVRISRQKYKKGISGRRRAGRLTSCLAVTPKAMPMPTRSAAGAPGGGCPGSGSRRTCGDPGGGGGGAGPHPNQIQERSVRG